MRFFALLVISLGFLAFLSMKTKSAQPACASVAQTENVLFQSTNGGDSWQDISQGLPDRFEVNSVYAQGDEVFIGAENGIVYHSSNPTSGHWDQENISGVFQIEQITGIKDKDRPRRLVDRFFSGQKNIYATIYEDGLFRKTPGQLHWQLVLNPLETLGHQSVQGVVENSNGVIFVSNSNGIFRSEDDTKTWKQVYDKGWVTNIAEFDGVLLGNNANGLIRSTDGGEHWETVLTDKGAIFTISKINGHITAIRQAGPWQTEEAEKGIPVRMSFDDGATWQRMDDGISSIEAVYDFKQMGEYLFCSHEGGISRSSDGGKTWDLVRTLDNKEKPIRFELVVSGLTVYAIRVWSGC